MSLWRPAAVKAFGITTGKDRVKVLWFATAVSAFLFGLLVVAFVTISLVVVAYVGPVGWVALGFVILFGVAGFGVIIWRSPLAWPKWVRMVEKEGVDTYGRMMHRQTRPQHDEELHWENKEQTPIAKLPKQRQTQERGRALDGREYDYGRSTSGEYREKREPSWRNTRREKEFDYNRHSGASTVRPDAYEPGLYGQSGIHYDDGIREGFVMSRYD